MSHQHWLLPLLTEVFRCGMFFLSRVMQTSGNIHFNISIVLLKFNVVNLVVLDFTSKNCPNFPNFSIASKISSYKHIEHNTIFDINFIEYNRIECKLNIATLFLATIIQACKVANPKRVEPFHRAVLDGYP